MLPLHAYTITVTAINPSTPSMIMKKCTLLQQAKLYFSSGDLEKSIEYFNAAEKEGCTTADICLSRGAVLMALGRYTEAKKDFNRIIKDHGKDERAHYYRGIANAALGMYTEAVSDLTRSLSLNNDRGIAHLVRGLSYAKLGQDSEARLDFNSAQAFSAAEWQSFSRIFGTVPPRFLNSGILPTRENAPWNNIMSRESAASLRHMLG